MSEKLNTCPTCGALPCDWTKLPAHPRQDEAKAASPELIEAARAVVERWDSPKWKDAEHTGVLIGRLREALNQQSVSDAYQLPAIPAQDKGSEG